MGRQPSSANWQEWGEKKREKEEKKFTDTAANLYLRTTVYLAKKLGHAQEK